MRTLNLKSVLFVALACALFVTACRKEDSANLNQNNAPKVEAVTGAILADKEALKNIADITLNNLACFEKKQPCVNELL